MEPLMLRGPTVTLRPLLDADAAALAVAASDSRDQYEYTRVPDGVEDARRYIDVMLADREGGRRLPFVIVWHDRVVGSTSYLDLQRWRWPAGSPLQRADHPMPSRSAPRGRPHAAHPSRGNRGP